VELWDADAGNVAKARAFLEQYLETSLFLLSNLESYGYRAGDSLNSGNFKLLAKGGRIEAVFCVSLRGNLLAQTGGRTDLAAAILEACTSEATPISGVLGEWNSAAALWELVLRSGGIVERHASRETLYRLELANTTPALAEDPRVRGLEPEDFEHWQRLQAAFLAEQGIPSQGTPEQLRANFDERAKAGHWWGTWVEGELRAMATLNAVYATTGQIGGVFTNRDFRRQGLSRATLQTLMADSMLRHRLGRLVLFTGQQNRAAIGLYESLGFGSIGEFALFFGSR
jgi:RimJ/RimL family protein N-acetyltransferase